MTTIGELRCRLCKANAQECGGYLARMNAKGQPGVWECRPSCTVDMHPDDALLAAIKGDSDE
jgi:hypothetical protein